MTSLRRAALFIEAAVFSVLVPGTVAFWLPAAILDERRISMPSSWSALQIAALIPLTVGAIIYLRCLWEFATRGRGIPAPVDHPKELVVSGLYRYVRNPMYLGVMLFSVGEAAPFRYPAFLVYAASWLLFVHLIILIYEEPNLRRKFGSSYERYVAAVSRWVPGQPYRG